NGECWKYDASTDDWQQQASFPEADTNYQAPLVSFSVNNAGYILKDLNHEAYNQGAPLRLWRYDAVLNQWTKTDDGYYGDGVRQVEAVSLDSVAYIGLGINRADFNAIDFWKYK